MVEDSEDIQSVFIYFLFLAFLFFGSLFKDGKKYEKQSSSFFFVSFSFSILRGLFPVRNKFLEDGIIRCYDITMRFVLGHWYYLAYFAG
jgi:hypothetical protein